MSLVKKCDICGFVYEIYNLKHNEDVAAYKNKKIDCCPECMKAIMNFTNDLRGDSKNE